MKKMLLTIGVLCLHAYIFYDLFKEPFSFYDSCKIEPESLSFITQKFCKAFIKYNKIFENKYLSALQMGIHTSKATIYAKRKKILKKYHPDSSDQSSNELFVFVDKFFKESFSDKSYMQTKLKLFALGIDIINEKELKVSNEIYLLISEICKHLGIGLIAFSVLNLIFLWSNYSFWLKLAYVIFSTLTVVLPIICTQLIKIFSFEIKYVLVEYKTESAIFMTALEIIGSCFPYFSIKEIELALIHFFIYFSIWLLLLSIERATNLKKDLIKTHTMVKKFKHSPDQNCLRETHKTVLEFLKKYFPEDKWASYKKYGKIAFFLFMVFGLPRLFE